MFLLLPPPPDSERQQHQQLRGSMECSRGARKSLSLSRPVSGGAALAEERWMLPNEHLATMGVPMYPKFAAGQKYPVHELRAICHGEKELRGQRHARCSCGHRLVGPPALLRSLEIHG